MDPQGHVWSFLQKLRDVTPEEMEAAVPGMKIWTPEMAGKPSASSKPESILRSAESVLLVDWPSTKVPRALIEAGLTVFGYAPHHYSKGELVSGPPSTTDLSEVFPPEAGEDKGFLVFHRLASGPAKVDIVSVYRPAAELPGIIEAQALPLGATAVWLQRPVASAEERRLVQKHGLKLVENCDIAETARGLGRRKL
jgi:predicted CoA-binding protein